MVEPWPTGSWRVESRTALQERAGLSPYRHLTDEEKVEMRALARLLFAMSEEARDEAMQRLNHMDQGRVSSIMGSMRSGMQSPYDGLDEGEADALHAEARRITELPPSERAAAVTLSAPDRDGHSRLATVVGSMRSVYDGLDTAAASAAALAQATAEGLSLHRTSLANHTSGFTGVYRKRSRFEVTLARAGKLRFIGAFGTAEEGALAYARGVVQAERVAAAARVEAGVEAEADMSDTVTPLR